VSPLFSVLHQTIDFVRGIESQLTSSAYQSVNLSYEPLLTQGPLAYRLVDFVNSWEVFEWEVWFPTPNRDAPRETLPNPKEEMVKELLKALILKHQIILEGDLEADRFVKLLAHEMLSIYPPEI